MSYHSKQMLVIGLFAAVAPLTLSAHETWLAATDRSIGTGSSLSFDMSSGEQFPTMETAIEPNRIEAASCRQGTAQSRLKPAGKGAKALRLNVQLATREGATCWVQLKPKNLDLSVAKVEQYLKEIDAPESARRAWQSMPEPRRWNETYTKNAKVVVPAADGHPGTASPTPVGLKLEFVSDSDLSTGKLSGPLGITVLLDGKPLSGLAVALWSDAKGEPVWRTSDARGRVSFTVPSPGRWMVSGTDLRVLNAKAGKWKSQFSTLVFEIEQR